MLEMDDKINILGILILPLNTMEVITKPEYIAIEAMFCLVLRYMSEPSF